MRRGCPLPLALAETMMAKKNDGIGDLVRGTLTGLVATWAMSRVAAMMSDPADDAAAARALDEELDDETPGKLSGQPEWLLSLDKFMLGSSNPAAIPWELGAGAGALYGALRGRLPGADAASGTLFGAGLYLAADKAEARSARGVIPWLVFGVTAEVAIRALEKISK